MAKSIINLFFIYFGVYIIFDREKILFFRKFLNIFFFNVIYHGYYTRTLYSKRTKKSLFIRNTIKRLIFIK
jgi:hypothetical protein